MFSVSVRLILLISMSLIYKATNKINGKIYIGQTVRSFIERQTAHKRESFNKLHSSYNYPFHRAIRKYGFDNFEWEIIEKCPRELLNEKEIHYISVFKSYAPKNPNGYNLTIGGDNHWGSSGIHHYLNKMTASEKSMWLSNHRVGKNNPNFGNGKNLKGNNHWSRKVSKEDYDSWVNHFKGNNNYQKKMTKKELKEKSFFNKITPKEKAAWIKKNVLGDKNPYARAVKNNPNKYRGKNNACFGRSFPERHIKYILTYPDGKEEIITRLVKFCKDKPDITPYGLRKVLDGKSESYRGYKLRLT